MTTREIRRVVRGVSTHDGAGVKLTRVLGHKEIKDFDPFLMLDAFDSTNAADYAKGFPAHPHRGIETITYLVEGEIEHADSLGNKGVIRSGDCQWMTAGSGVVHSEMPKESPRLFGLQFWLNLPKESKMTRPKYRNVKAAEIPSVREGGATVRILSGVYGGRDGAMQTGYVKATLLDVEIDPGAEWRIDTDFDRMAYLYILEGAGKFTEEEGIVIQKNAILFTEGDEIRVRAGAAGVRFVLCLAKPLEEPIAWGGPIVMNTEKELEDAFVELREGSFIKDEAAV